MRFKADGSYDTEWGAAGTGNALPSGLFILFVSTDPILSLLGQLA